MVNFIKRQQQPVDVIAGNLLLPDGSDPALDFLHLNLDFLYFTILFIVTTLQIQNFSVIIWISHIQRVHLPLQP